MPRDEQLATRVDNDTKRRFRVEAAKRDMDMSELLREIVHDFLEEQEAAEGNSNPVAQVAD
jgi:antitoxin component of RelBE/YafQ-DinJ toxin-antitoxin module